MLEKVRAEVRLAGELTLTNLAAQEVTAFMAMRTSPAAAAVVEEPRLDLLAGTASRVAGIFGTPLRRQCGLVYALDMPDASKTAGRHQTAQDAN